VVTLVEPAKEFYPAEDYHQNYFNERGSKNPYCKIIPPKIEKIRKLYKDLIAKP
jgi:peptide methionine sulfoxide reductase MsrA